MNYLDEQVKLVARSDRKLIKALTMQCGRPTIRSGKKCSTAAGHGTQHPGYGPCKTHGTARQHGAWVMALDVARELNVSPWEALLTSVRLAAGRVAWVDEQLRLASQANDGDMNVPVVGRWLAESRKERTLMARTAKAAIDAGVAERIVRQVELEGQIVAEVIGRVIDKLGLDPERRMFAFEEAHRQLLVLESPSGAPVEVQGTWSPLQGDNTDRSNTEGDGGAQRSDLEDENDD